jgi:hypothetical protein
MAVSFDPLGSHTLSRSVYTLQKYITICKNLLLFPIIFYEEPGQRDRYSDYARSGVQIPVSVKNVSVLQKF